MIPLFLALTILFNNQSNVSMLSNTHFDIYYHKAKKQLAEIVSDYSISEFEKISRNLHSKSEKRINISIINENELKNNYAQYFPEWGIGFAIPDENLIILKFPVSFFYPRRLKFVIGHEIAHILLHRKAETHIPRWFDEGSAIYLSRDLTFLDEVKLSIAVLTKSIIPLNQLNNSFPRSKTNANLAYIESAFTIEFLVSEFGEQILTDILEQTSEFNDFSKGFLQATGGMELSVFQLEWNHYLKRTFVLTFLLKPNLIFLIVAFLALSIGISKRFKGRKSGSSEKSFEN